MSKRSIRKRRHRLAQSTAEIDAMYRRLDESVAERVQMDAMIYGTGVARVTKDGAEHVPFEEAWRRGLTDGGDE